MRRLRHKEEISQRSKGRILKAASKIFVENGFAGSSLGTIAKKIDVNQSLIYHYFPSKEDLWKTVKEQYLNDYIAANKPSFDVEKGFRHFVESYLQSGFDYFRKHPDTVRILSWQSLEGSSEKLMVMEMADQDLLMGAVTALQKKGEIRSDLDPQFVILMLRNAQRAPFFDDYAAFEKDPEQGSRYVQLTVEGLMRAFKR